MVLILERRVRKSKSIHSKVFQILYNIVMSIDTHKSLKRIRKCLGCVYDDLNCKPNTKQCNVPLYSYDIAMESKLRKLDIAITHAHAQAINQRQRTVIRIKSVT